MYFPSLLGYCFLTLITAQDGTTLRFLFPSFPKRHIVNCRYAAFLSLLVPKVASSALMSAHIRTFITRMSKSRQYFVNLAYFVTQNFLWQHLFSMTVGISTQFPHMHHGGVTFVGSSGCGSLSSSNTSFKAVSDPAPLLLHKRIILTRSSRSNDCKYSWSRKRRK